MQKKYTNVHTDLNYYQFYFNKNIILKMYTGLKKTKKKKRVLVKRINWTIQLEMINFYPQTNYFLL